MLHKQGPHMCTNRYLPRPPRLPPGSVTTIEMNRIGHIAAAALVLLVLCSSAAAQTTGLTLPGAGAAGARTYGTPMPGKTNVVVGCIAPFSTRPAPSAAIVNGIRLAIADAAKTVGPNMNVLLTCEDSKGTAAGATAAMKALASKAVGVIGDFTSSATLGALEGADKSKVPLISPAASSPALTKKGDYFFRVVPNDMKQAAAAAKLVAKSGAKAMAVVQDGSVYGKSLTEAFTAALEAEGGKVAATVDLASPAGAKAAVGEVTKAKADAVFFAMNDVAAAAAFIKDAASMKLMLFAGDSIMDPDLFKALGANAAMLVAGMRGTGFTLGSPAFRTRFTTFANSPDPPPVAAHSYDAATLLLKAYVAAAAPKKGPEVAAAVAKTTFSGAVGSIVLDAAGDLVPTKDTYSIFKFGPKGQLVVA